ncbi:MAG: ATP-binding protein [Chromatiaceae bacterium]|nr:ATP-binding protein [Chromatiaceae bacterium]
MDPHYDWARFLVPRDGGIGLDSTGFLRDPTEEFGTLENPDLTVLSRLDQLSVTVLLGEPGMGKSTLLAEARTRAESEGRRVVPLDLASFSSEDRLLRRLTAPEILKAEGDGIPTDLLIDSFDTGLLGIPTLADFLADAFRDYPVSPHLRIRLACRSAVWPASLEETLVAHWGNGAVGIYELAPLRRCDVSAAATTEGIDQDAFLAKVDAHHAGPIAARPVTLRFLLRGEEERRPFPTSRAELYRQGCEQLCAEDNTARRDSLRTGNRTASERLIIASRIAAVLLLTNREAVWKGRHAEIDQERDCSVDDLVGCALMPDGSPLQITRQDIEETLDTGLFWLRGPNRLHFAHQTYGEFLSAWYLQSQSVPTQKKLELLSNPSDASLVPQLHEVTAWSAALEGNLFRAVLNIYPPVLLTSDAATAVPELREDLVGGILELAQQASWADTDWGLPTHYRNLAHPNLVSQLSPWIENPDHLIVARRIAIDITEACKLTDFQDLLLDVALNSSDEPAIRSQAVDALGELADRDNRKRLLPLLDLPWEEDRDEELKGDVLQAVWPDAIDVNTVLAHLNPPRWPNHLGSYHAFLTGYFAPGLTSEHMPAALRWARGKITPESADSWYDDTFPEILAKAFEHIAAPLVATELARTTLAMLKTHHDLLPNELANGDLNPLQNKVIRRQLLLAMLPLIQDPEQGIWMLSRRLHDGTAILIRDDVPWLLELASESEVPTTTWTLAQLLNEVYNPNLAPRLANRILEACADNDVLRRALAKLCRPVGLWSREARYIRERRDRLQEIEARRSRSMPVPSPRIRVEGALARIEGGDTDAFVVLLKDMRLRTDGRYVYGDHGDIRELPGWQDASDRNRERIVAAACNYLRNGDPQHERLLQVGQPLDSTRAATRAMYLRDTIGREHEEALPEPDWERWAPAMLPRFNDVKDEDWAEDVLRRAYAAAPRVLYNLIRRLLDRDLEKDHWAPTADGLEIVWDTEIARLVLNVTKAARANPSIFRSLYAELLRNDPEVAIAYGLIVMGSLPQIPNDAERRVAIIVATLLIKRQIRTAWEIVWVTLKRDDLFGRMLIKSLAADWNLNGDWWSWMLTPSLGDLANWIEATFFSETRSSGREGSRRKESYGTSFDLEHLRNNVLGALVNRGTSEAVSAMERIADAFPEKPWLQLRLARSRESLRRTLWCPPSPAELLELIADGSKRLVRNDNELLALLLESLQQLQERLQGWNSLVRSLWDEGVPPRPKDEDFLSDFVRDHLERDLKGVAAQREVQVRRRKPKGIGERTDILVTATTAAPPDGIDQAAVVIETKGCWNRELQTAMNDQLTKRYLIDSGHRCGIYLVGWYESETSEAGKRHCAKGSGWTIDDARTHLGAQARSLCDDQIKIRAFVLDACLPDRNRK